MTTEATRQAEHYREVRARLRGEVRRKQQSPAQLEWRQAKRAAAAIEPARSQLRIRSIHVEMEASMVTWKSIIRDVASKAGSTPAEVCSTRRDPNLVRARHEAAYRMTRELGLSMPQIGVRLGNRDHTTVLYGLRKYEAYLAALAIANSPSDVPYSSIRMRRDNGRPYSGGPAGTPNA
jgi:chromosomal replication initiation ATPase DnaA